MYVNVRLKDEKLKVSSHQRFHHISDLNHRLNKMSKVHTYLTSWNINLVKFNLDLVKLQY